MNQDVDGNPPDWVEWVQNPHGICCTEPENVLPFAYHHECLKRVKRTKTHYSQCSLAALQYKARWQKSVINQ